MSKTITINNGGRYDDQSYTDERHYHYKGAGPSEEKTDGEKDAGAAALRVRLRLVEALLEVAGASTRNIDRIKLCRLMAFATGTTEGYVKKIYTERHVDTTSDSCKTDIEKLRRLLADVGLALGV